MAEGMVHTPMIPSKVPRSPMSPIGVQSPFVPPPRIPVPDGTITPFQNVTP